MPTVAGLRRHAPNRSAVVPKWLYAALAVTGALALVGVGGLVWMANDPQESSAGPAALNAEADGLDSGTAQRYPPGLTPRA